MPELPDVDVYCAALESRIEGEPLSDVRLLNPFVLRTAVPPVIALQGKRVQEIRRMGKRIVLGFEDDLYLVIHLMIAGRLHWLPAGAKSKGRNTLAILEFPRGRLALTEAGTKRRASLHVVQGEAALASFDRGGLEVQRIDQPKFAARLTAENHTLKWALTDPRTFSGIGNAYSDEILHRARLSPLALTRKLSPDAIGRLYDATRFVLDAWTAQLADEARDKFPEKVTAFRTGMAVHGRFGLPCPDCGAPVQRIVYADNECNYCARCQTNGVILADRALSRLLHQSFPRSLDDA